MVCFTDIDGQAALPGNYTFAAGDNGVHPFNATLKTAGTQAITATTTTTSSITGSQTGIIVNPAAASKPVFGTQPSNTVAGNNISPAVTVKVQDTFGNLIVTSTAAITMAIGTNAGTPTAGTLSGTKTVNAVNGVATFSDLSIDKTATGYTLRASSGALTPATGNPFKVKPGAA